MMTKLFSVAGHAFSVTMNTDSPLWNCMENYAPFLMEGECPQEERVFSLETLPDDNVDTPHGRLLLSGADEEEGAPRLDVFQSLDGQGLLIKMAPVQSAAVCAALEVSADYTKGQLRMTGSSRSRKFALDNSLMLMYAFSTACKRTLEMHASVVENGGHAYMFLGVSGAGKSTHSRMWLENIPGTVLVNDDNPIVRVFDDGRVMVYGSPWSGKTACYKKLEHPLKGTVSIIKAPHNVLRRLDAISSYAKLYSSCSGYRPDSAMADGMHATLETFTLNVPGYELECLPDGDAARVCKQGIDGDTDAA